MVHFLISFIYPKLLASFVYTRLYVFFSLQILISNVLRLSQSYIYYKILFSIDNSFVQ